MRTAVLALGLLVTLAASAASAQGGRYWRDGYEPYPYMYYDDECPICRRNPYMERFRADESYGANDRYGADDRYYARDYDRYYDRDEAYDEEIYAADRRAHDRSRHRLRNTFLGAGIANELFNKGSSKNFIRGASVGGFVLNEIFNR